MLFWECGVSFGKTKFTLSGERVFFSLVVEA
jgi:hypothetical protein